MESARRRRRLALAVGCGLAAGAFAFGVALGDGGSSAPRPSAASQLSPRELVGERLAVGVAGTGLSPALERMVREGRVAGVILFAESFPTREAGRRLIARLQAIPRPRGLRDPLLVMVDQ